MLGGNGRVPTASRLKKIDRFRTQHAYATTRQQTTPTTANTYGEISAAGGVVAAVADATRGKAPVTGRGLRAERSNADCDPDSGVRPAVRDAVEVAAWLRMAPDEAMRCVAICNIRQTRRR